MAKASRLPTTDELVVLAKKLAHCCAKAVRRHYDRDAVAADILGEVWIALADAAQRFDPDKGEFFPFAARKAFGRAHDAYRGRLRQQHRNSAKFAKSRNALKMSLRALDSGSKIGVLDMLAADDSFGEMVRLMPHRSHQLFMDLRYRAGLKMSEIAQVIGVSESAVYQISDQVNYIIKTAKVEERNGQEEAEAGCHRGRACAGDAGAADRDGDGDNAGAAGKVIDPGEHAQCDGVDD